MSINYTPGIRTHLSMGMFYGTLASIIQGFIEALILLIWYNGYIFGPQNVFKSQILFVFNKIFYSDGAGSIPFILDKYLGPGLIDKMPLVCNLVAVYAVVGLVAGAFLGIFVWTVLKFIKSSMSSDRLSSLYLSSLFSFVTLGNLAIWLNRKIASFTVLGLLINLGFIVVILFFSILIYKAVCILEKKFLQTDKTVSLRVIARRGRVALLVVLLITCTVVVLNLWVFGGGNSQTYASQANSSSTYNGSTNPGGGRDINVVLISIDSLRADHLSCYGYSRETSPNIDVLAKDGVLFSNAYSTTSWTLPAHMSMLTSMYSESHGVITDQYSLDEKRTTLAEALKKEGYTTAAFISGAYLHSRYGFKQGFDLYDDFTISETAQVGGVTQAVTSPRLNRAIQGWLGDNYKKKFFLFLHYFDVHFDYVPPSPYDTMFDPNYKGTIDARNFFRNPRVNPEMDTRDLQHVIALYDGEIAFTDKYVGEVLSSLKELGVYDSTLIIVTADHGDEFFEHGWKGHKRTLYDEVLHVPLILKFPSNFKLENSKEVEAVVSIIDIMSTILDYLGIKPHEEMQGRSLLSLINGDRESNDSMVYSRLEHKLVAVRSINSKLIHSLRIPEKELYDLANDPQEKVNLFNERTLNTIPEGERHLISLLHWLNTQRQTYQSLTKSDSKKEIELSESVKEELRSLGYMQ